MKRGIIWNCSESIDESVKFSVPGYIDTENQIGYWKTRYKKWKSVDIKSGCVILQGFKNMKECVAETNKHLATIYLIRHDKSYSKKVNRLKKAREIPYNLEEY